MIRTATGRTNATGFGIALLTLALSACSDLSTPNTDARNLERAALEAAASQVDESAAFDPTGWEAIGPDVWRRAAYDDNGRRTGERIKAHGPYALEWLRDVYFPEQIILIEAELESGAAGVDRIELEDRLDTARRFVTRVGDWGRGAASSSVLPAQGCTASANASAGPTTASPGAKAYANGRNCSFYQSGWIDTYAFAGGNEDDDSEYLHQYGDSGSVSAATYGNAGTTCYSRGEAVGYPDAFDYETHSASC